MGELLLPQALLPDAAIFWQALPVILEEKKPNQTKPSFSICKNPRKCNVHHASKPWIRKSLNEVWPKKALHNLLFFLEYGGKNAEPKDFTQLHVVAHPAAVLLRNCYWLGFQLKQPLIKCSTGTIFCIHYLPSQSWSTVIRAQNIHASIALSQNVPQRKRSAC